MMRRWIGAAATLALLAGCSSSGDSGEPDSPDEGNGELPAAEAGATLTVPLGGTGGPVPSAGRPTPRPRPFQLYVPESYHPDTDAPLVVLLHGFTSSGAEQENYFQLTAESDRRGFLYAMPDGTVDPDGERFWNATEACCDFHGTGVDDSAYLRDLIETVTSAYPVDPERVYLVGHSNGGFMAYRMACDHADVVTSVVSLAGSMPDRESDCRPTEPVSVLQIHGTADRIIPFSGGANFGNPFPSAETIMSRWLVHNGCTDEETDPGRLDLERGRPGDETSVTAYTSGCREQTRMELWSIEAGGHAPELTADFAPAVIDFLYAAGADR